MPDDFSPEEQNDQIEARISRDSRLALIRQSLDVEAELRDSPTWRYIRHRIEVEKAEITADLADPETSPTDLGRITRLQARAIAAESIPRWLGEMIATSRALEDQIAVEDGRAPASD